MNKREQFLVYMMNFIGLPYIWGGSNPKIGLDCSGLVQILLAWLHLDPPGDQTADDLMKYFTTHGTVVSDVVSAQLGDLVFYGSTSAKATHIAMVLGNGLMIEAGGGGSKCTTPEIARKLGACIRVSPVKRRKDLIKIIRPGPDAI
ncbi:MAG: C40 family peptidase [Pseudobdellovibrionaceae bacterium]